MTLEEAAQSLPNGFHGAKIDTLVFNARERSLRLELQIWMGTIFERPAQEDIYQPGTLLFTTVDQFTADKRHGKTLPINWVIRSVETATSSEPVDDGEPPLTGYTLQLGFKEQLLILARHASFEWTSGN